MAKYELISYINKRKPLKNDLNKRSLSGSVASQSEGRLLTQQIFFHKESKPQNVVKQERLHFC